MSAIGGAGTGPLVPPTTTTTTTTAATPQAASSSSAPALPNSTGITDPAAWKKYCEAQMFRQIQAFADELGLNKFNG